VIPERILGTRFLRLIPGIALGCFSGDGWIAPASVADSIYILFLFR